jgi:glutathione synthase/RimK-type ligase-like ATP-grasp enzyme
MKKCAILSMDCLDNFEAYDHLIDQPMFNAGWQTEVVSWHNKTVDWNAFDAVIIRTPWDYQDDAETFLQVLEEIENSKAHLENSLKTVRWNIDKQYLQTLAHKQVNIVPTLWPKYFEAGALPGYFEHFNTEQIVIKPTISANSDNTFWLTRDNFATMSDELANIFAHRNFMVQPFMEQIVNEGEFSCFYFNGHFSHAILKTPKENDFRVQEEHGGQLLKITPEIALLEQSAHVLTQLPEMPLYARIDFVRKNSSMQGAEFALMEAELIEPSLYFNMDELAAQRFTEAFIEKMATVLQTN